MIRMKKFYVCLVVSFCVSVLGGCPPPFCSDLPECEEQRRICPDENGKVACGGCIEGYEENDHQECVRYEYRCEGNACGADFQRRECVGIYCQEWETHLACEDNQVCSENFESNKCITCDFGCLNGICQGCEVDSGPCCDENGQPKPATEVCAAGTDYRCVGKGCGDDVQTQAWTKHCDGATHLCEGEKVLEGWELDADCGTGALCQEQVESKPICSQCGHICYEGTCKDCVPSSGPCCDVQGYFKEIGAACGDPTNSECSDPDTCDGAGTCLPNHKPEGAPCEDQGVVCLEDDTCDGNGKCINNGYSPEDTPCGDKTNTECDKPNTCNGTGTCQDNFKPNKTPCGDQVGDQDDDNDCNESDYCDGAGACLENYKPSSWSCDEWMEYRCSRPGCGALAQKRKLQQYCSGSSRNCDGPIPDPPWELIKSCNDMNDVCETDKTTYAECTPCDENNVCHKDSCVGDAGTWITISGGSFMMGSNSGDSDELPIHQVNVPTFEMTQTEVTVGQYKSCVNEGACSAPNTGGSCNWTISGREAHPVNCVDWNQAVAFCEWAGGRLPSEAEWEYAARSGGQDITYPWGNEFPTCDYCVMDDGGHGCGQNRTWAVCSKTAGNTDHGLCDMAGNIWEWVQDWYHSTYNGAPTDGSAWEDPAGLGRVSRGGAWGAGNASVFGASSRVVYQPSYWYSSQGFRCARLP